MRKKTAINILIKQRDKVIATNHYNDATWVFHTASHIKEFFGHESPEYHFISQFTFTAVGTSLTSKEEWLDALRMKETQAVRFLENCIQTIKDKGLFKPPKQNFLQRFSDTWLTTIIVLILTGVGSAAFFMGKYSEGLNTIELKRELQDTKDSLELLKVK